MFLMPASFVVEGFGPLLQERVRSWRRWKTIAVAARGLSSFLSPVVEGLVGCGEGHAFWCGGFGCLMYSSSRL